MFYLRFKKTVHAILTLAIIYGILFMPLSVVKAADHADSTFVTLDPGADLADTFAFLDPSDNSKVILAMTFAGFIVPSEAVNFGLFAPDILYRFEIENTGDAVADRYIDITFSPQTSRTVPQTATVELTGRKGIRKQPYSAKFTAPTTLPTLAATAPPFVVTTDPVSGISFFAGLTDDPFFFDIVGFGRFNTSVMSGNPDPTRLQRARDSFAGYNIHTIAMRIPVAFLRGTAGDMIGVNNTTLRQRFTTRQDNGQSTGSGDYVQIDRSATPALNTVLIPFPRKNEYNVATPLDDANLVFANSIIASLTALGTSQSNIVILANVAVFKGDYLRLNLATPNTSLGVGERITTPNYTGFPNGRRIGDDTVDVLMYFITNQAILMGDNVNSNEVPLTAAFPYFGRPHQPLENPTCDPTQN